MSLDKNKTLTPTIRLYLGTLAKVGNKYRPCDNKILEAQEYLKECRVLPWERRNLKMDTEGGKIHFFKKVEKKLG